jgi:hypothetical protein
MKGDSDEEKGLRPKIVLAGQLSSNLPLNTEEKKKDKSPFAFTFKAAPIEEKKGDFGEGFKSEAKMFANRNLFINPMISNQQPASSKPKLKTEFGEDYIKKLQFYLESNRIRGPDHQVSVRYPWKFEVQESQEKKE